MEHLKVYVSCINVPKVCRPVILAFTSSVSALTEVAEELLSYFADISNTECFSPLLYICIDLLRSDVVGELSWRHGLNNFYMPYKIQVQRSLVSKLVQLEKEVKE
ncbi:hypothetical protein C8R43DRAFT_1040109 [Mycena crocata]|nr:hypothetical protein C8R43DRAFT_1040109 [Mycena crocata]